MKNDAVLRYAKALGVSPGWILFGEGDGESISPPIESSGYSRGVISEVVKYLNREGALGSGTPQQTADEFLQFCEWMKHEKAKGEERDKSAAAIVSFIKRKLGVTDAKPPNRRPIQKSPDETDEEDA